MCTVVYSWYLLWRMPFIRSTATPPIIVWTLSIIPTYHVWHPRTLGRPWVLLVVRKYGSVAASAIIALLRITRSPRHTRFSASRGVCRSSKTTFVHSLRRTLHDKVALFHDHRLAIVGGAGPCGSFLCADTPTDCRTACQNLWHRVVRAN